MNTDPRFPTGDRNADDLERLLARNPVRPPPAGWRDAILAQASAPSTSHSAVVATERNAADPTNGKVRTNLGMSRPKVSPLGWLLRGLNSGWTVAAASWALVFALNYVTTPKASLPRRSQAPWSAAALAEFRAQQRAALDFAVYAAPEPARPPDSPPPNPPRRSSPRPGTGASLSPGPTRQRLPA